MQANAMRTSQQSLACLQLYDSFSGIDLPAVSICNSCGIMSASCPLSNADAIHNEKLPNVSAAVCWSLGTAGS